MDKLQAPKKFKNDLEERTALFARRVRTFVRQLPKNITALEDGKQLVRSSGSIGANYIEANESLSKKDFLVRAKICRKEAKETRYWLSMFDELSPAVAKERDSLMQEATEFLRMFSAMISKF